MTTESSRFTSELDQALRRHTEPECQYKALNQVSGFFLKHHHDPILQSSVFLKLADFFKDGNNGLRAYIMQTFERCKPFMHHIHNLDELIRRILVVIGSDDSLGRSMSFRVLGSFASVAHERLDIQHCMLVSLKEQFDWSIEFESIVYAAGETAHHSLVFSRKLFELVVHIATCSDYPKLVKSIAVKRLCPILGKHTSLERQAWMLLKQFP